MSRAEAGNADAPLGPWSSLADTHGEGEGVAVWTQLLHQLLLQGTQGPGVLLGRGEDLHGADMQVLPEGEAQDVQVLAAVAEGAGQSDKHWRGGTRGVASAEPSTAETNPVYSLPASRHYQSDQK